LRVYGLLVCVIVCVKLVQLRRLFHICGNGAIVPVPYCQKSSPKFWNKDRQQCGRTDDGHADDDDIVMQLPGYRMAKRTKTERAGRDARS